MGHQTDQLHEPSKQVINNYVYCKDLSENWPTVITESKCIFYVFYFIAEKMACKENTWSPFY